MNANLTSLDWYLEIDSKKVGPYSAEQILGLLREGEIPVNQRVLNTTLQTGWISVGELQNRVALPFKPPERPDNLLASIKIDPDFRHSDAANSLFDALVMSKEKRQKQIESERGELIPLDQAPGTIRRPLLVQNQVWLYGFIAGLLIFAFWGLKTLMFSPETPTAGGAPHSSLAVNPIQTVSPGAVGSPGDSTDRKEIERERERLKTRERELEKERESEKEKLRQQQREMEKERERRRDEDERRKDPHDVKPADDFRDPEQIRKLDDNRDIPPMPELPEPLSPLEPPPTTLE